MRNNWQVIIIISGSMDVTGDLVFWHGVGVFGAWFSV
jgi:hypothetical protein